MTHTLKEIKALPSMRMEGKNIKSKVDDMFGITKVVIANNSQLIRNALRHQLLKELSVKG